MSETDKAVIAIVEEQRLFVHSLAVRFAPWPGLADDITQQVFLEFINKADQWDLQRDVRPLLAAMTRNVALRAWREHTRTLPDQLRELAEHVRCLANNRNSRLDPSNRSMLSNFARQSAQKAAASLNSTITLISLRSILRVKCK